MRLIRWGSASIGHWLILSILVIPFPFAILPQLTYTQSDSILLYKVVATLSIPAFSISLFQYWRKTDFNKWNEIIHTILAYILIFFLLKYGFDKVFKNQFYFPEPNILHTPLGQLNKDILFWSTMGTSYGYNIFMGIIEIVPALLLIGRRTRFLGCVLAFGVLLNVWAINIGFDISVKLLSTILLLSAIYILLYYWRLIVAMCTLDYGDLKKNQFQSLKKSSFTKRLAKGITLSIICMEVFLPFIEYETFNMDNKIKQFYAGSFNVVKMDENSILSKEIIRIHFHNDGYLITESENQEFVDLKIETSIGKPGFILKERNLSIQYSETDSCAQMTWKNNNQDHIIELSRINLDDLPIAQDDFHLTMESY